MAEVGTFGYIARVRWATDDGLTAHVELRNGTIATATGLVDPVSVGDVLHVEETDNGHAVSQRPREEWHEESWVGVVKLRNDGATIVDGGGRLRLVPTADTPTYAVGNTVEVRDFEGVVRVLSQDPIRHLDDGFEESAVDRFRRDVGTGPGFEDFGGLQAVVERAQELIEVPLKNHAKLAAIGARAIKGVLFTGPPGTGKTLLARIIAAQADATFFEISGPEIFSKWYGESEKLLRALFSAAAAEDRAIIFFDEIDSVAGQRDDTAHEASKRVVAQLLTLMDGFSADSNVVVIATTNRPQDLDVALRRPGRFDWEIEFPLPGVEDRADILKKTARGLRTSGVLPHHAVAEATEGWSSAELAAIWSEASLLAVSDGREAIFAEDYLGGLERVGRQRRQLQNVVPAKEQR